MVESATSKESNSSVPGRNVIVFHTLYKNLHTIIFTEVVIVIVTNRNFTKHYTWFFHKDISALYLIIQTYTFKIMVVHYMYIQQLNYNFKSMLFV